MGSDSKLTSSGKNLPPWPKTQTRGKQQLRLDPASDVRWPVKAEQSGRVGSSGLGRAAGPRVPRAREENPLSATCGREQKEGEGLGGACWSPNGTTQTVPTGLNLRFCLGLTCENWGLHWVCRLGQLFSHLVGTKNQTRLCLEVLSGVGTPRYPFPFIPQPSSLPRAREQLENN